MPALRFFRLAFKFNPRKELGIGIIGQETHLMATAVLEIGAPTRRSEGENRETPNKKLDLLQKKIYVY